MKKFNELVAIAKKLRSETGCPWDRKQTVASFAPNVGEEADEIVEAIEKNDDENLAEEIGDTLFNLVMLSQIATEERGLDLEKILDDAAEKIKRRHSWVFGDDAEKVKTAEDALKFWQENKKKKK